MNNIPIIRLEVDRMKFAICTALTDYQLLMSQELQIAIDNFCTPEHISAIVNEQTIKTLEIVIKEEVDKFFRYGDGREVIANSVKEKLLNKKTYTPLDDYD